MREDYKAGIPQICFHSVSFLINSNLEIFEQAILKVFDKGKEMKGFRFMKR